jgi:hypothetical protein
MFFRFALVSLMFVPYARSQTWVGLAPSSEARGRGEAVTANAHGSDALFYNPALLRRQRFSARLVGLELNSDEASVKLARKAYTEQEKGFELAEVYSKFNSDQPSFFSTTARALDIVTPFVAASSFASMSGSSFRPEVSGEQLPYYDMSFGADVGIIGGFAVGLYKLSLGYSQYTLTRAQIDTNPFESTINQIRTESKEGTLNTSDINFRDFTQFYYGGTRGHNAGMSLALFDDNPSNISVSVLNIGGSKFTSDSPIDRKDFRKAEDKLLEEAATYSIELRTPTELQQITNAGIYLGYERPDSIINSGVTIDYHDIGNDAIKQKLAASYHFGIEFPDKLAMAAAKPFIIKEKHVIHAGLLGLKAFGGTRIGSYATEGLGMTFHIGYNMLVSLIRIDLEAYRIHPLGDNPDNITQSVGGKATVGLTLIF